jgi:predicted DNA-binding transcriptional regulator YafY
MTESIGGKFDTTSHKLLSKIKNEDFNLIYTKLNIEDISDRFDDIQVIEKAIKNKTELVCNYENEREGTFKANIQPLKIVNYEGFWYLVAFRDGYVQKYYIKTLSNIEETTEAFTVEENIEELLENSINIWFKADIEPFEVKIYADKTATKYFKRRALPTQVIETLSQDGTMEFVVTITDEMEIIPIIKYWLPHLRVLEPLWISEMIDEDLEVYLNKGRLNGN